MCTGNIFRSPLAEGFARAFFAASATPVAVGSAGTHARPAPAHPYTAVLLRRLGGCAGPRYGRPLSRELVARAGLVLTAALEHRAAVVDLYPRAARFAFTLREFDVLTGAVATDAIPPGLGPHERARAVVAEAAALRGQVRHLTPADYDIPDPCGAPFGFHEAVGEQIARALAAPLALINS